VKAGAFVAVWLDLAYVAEPEIKEVLQRHDPLELLT